MNRGDELLDFILDDSERRPAIPKPRYFYGDRAEFDQSNPYAHYDDIPEEQFFDPDQVSKK